jgi:hypothetical protein
LAGAPAACRCRDRRRRSLSLAAVKRIVDMLWRELLVHLPALRTANITFTDAASKRSDWPPEWFGWAGAMQR